MYEVLSVNLTYHFVSEYHYQNFQILSMNGAPFRFLEYQTVFIQTVALQKVKVA